MADMLRVRTALSGWSGGPGLTTFYFGGAGSPTGPEATEAVARVQAFWNSFKATMPTGVLIQVSGAVDTIDPATGTLTGGFTIATPSAISANGAGGFAPVSTAILLRHQTGVIVAGRRLTGRTFLSPITAASILTTGAISSTASTATLTAANLLKTTIVTGLSPLVWHRPKNGSGGSSAFTAGFDTPSKPAVLKSRRD